MLAAPPDVTPENPVGSPRRSQQKTIVESHVRTGAPKTANALALVLVAVTAVLIAGTVTLLDGRGTDQKQVIIGGLAGSVASSVAMLLRRGGLVPLEDTLARYGFMAVFVPVVSGMAAGAFSVLTAIALFSVRSGQASLASGAAFGGLYGLLLGGWTNSLLTDQGNAVEARTIADIALSEIGLGVTGARSQQYNGTVRLRFSPEDGDGIVLGSLCIVFVPAARANSDDDQGWVTGPIRVDEGELADEASFAVSVIVETGLAAFPRSRELTVPVAEVSDMYDFTIVRDVAPTDAEGGSASWPTAPTLLVDIGQAGRTVQLIELPASGKNAPESVP